MTETHRSGCLEANMLAEYIDGGLESRQRAEVEAHLAECGECYENFAEAVRASGVVNLSRGVIPARSNARRWWYLAAAAALVLAVGVPATLRYRGPEAAIGRLVTASGVHRVTEARTGEDFAWGAVPQPVRGNTAESLPTDTTRAILDLRDATAGAADAASLRGAGLAALLSGDLNAAISSFEQSVAVSDDPRARLDLSAAIFERWRRDQQAADLFLALDHVSRVLTRNPSNRTAQFNQALIQESLGLNEQSERSWVAFLDGEPADSPWAREARAHLEAIRKTKSTADRSVPAGNLPPVTTDDNTAQVRDFLESYLSDWPTSLLDLHRSRIAKARARELASERRDATLPMLIAASSRATSPAVSVCLRELIALRRDARNAFDEARLAAVGEFASRADRAARCAGLPTSGLSILELQASLNSTRDPRILARMLGEQAAAETRSDWESVARIEQSAATAMIRNAEFDRAIGHAMKAATAFARAGHPGAAGSLYASMGETFSNEGDFVGAARSFRAAFQRLPQMRAYRAVHASLSLAATAAQAQGLPGAARVFGAELEAYAAGFQNGAGLVMSRLIQARAAADLGDPVRARELLTLAAEALPMVEDAGLRSGYRAELDWHTGVVLQRTDPPAAIHSLDAAQATFRRTGNAVRLANVLLVKGSAELASGNIERANAAWNAGLDVIDAQRTGTGNSQLRVSRLDSLWGLYANLISLARATPDEALWYWERGRARVLLDAIGSDAKMPALDRAALRNWLPATATVIAYSIHENELLVFVITRDAVRLQPVAVPRRQLEREVDTYVTAVREGRAPSNGITLSRWLIPDFVVLSADREIVFMPDGNLHSVPFASLPIGPAARPLVTQSVPIVSPGLAILKRMTALARPTASARALLVSADGPSPSRGLPDLPGARTEVAALEPMYAAADLWSGREVSRARLLAALPRATLFHFAGHGVSSDRSARRNGLIVPAARAVDGDDDVITVSDIAALPLHPGMTAILSACDTGTGIVARGEGVASLARGFLAAGAGSVIASLWLMPDRDSVAFVVSVHRGLRSGASPALALARAQREAISSAHTTAVWSAFQVNAGLVTGGNE